MRDAAWKARVHLCARYRRLAAAGTPSNIVTAVIARELAAFVQGDRAHGARAGHRGDADARVARARDGAIPVPLWARRRVRATLGVLPRAAKRTRHGDRGRPETNNGPAVASPRIRG